jgi:hypothetical protein
VSICAYVRTHKSPICSVCYEPVFRKTPDYYQYDKILLACWVGGKVI